MQEAPLMPKATAVWLVENTALSFDQVAEFCKLHPLEVKAIADGDAAQGIKGLDPIQTGQLTREEIEKAVADPEPQAAALQAQGPAAGGQGRQEKGPALHPGVAPPGPAERDPVADPQPSRAQGRPDHAAGRHHQVDHPGHPRPHPLERREPDAARSGDARAVLADRSRFRGAARLQGEAGAGRQRRDAAARRGHHRAAAGAGEPETPAAAKAKDDLNVDAVFAKLKQLGGKSEDKDE